MEKGARWAGGRGGRAGPGAGLGKGSGSVGEGVSKAGPGCFDNIIALLLKAQ